jgi:hypothetical protein
VWIHARGPFGVAQVPILRWMPLSDAAGMLSDFYQGLVDQIHGGADAGVAGADGGAIEVGSVDTGTEVSTRQRAGRIALGQLQPA